MDVGEHGCKVGIVLTQGIAPVLATIQDPCHFTLYQNKFRHTNQIANKAEITETTTLLNQGSLC